MLGFFKLDQSGFMIYLIIMMENLDAIVALALAPTCVLELDYYESVHHMDERIFNTFLIGK